MSEPLYISNDPEAQGAPEGSDRAVKDIKLTFKNVVWPLLLSLVVLLVIGYLTFEPEAFKATLADVSPWFMTGIIAMVILRVIFGPGDSATYLVDSSGSSRDCVGSLRGTFSPTLRRQPSGAVLLLLFLSPKTQKSRSEKPRPWSSSPFYWTSSGLR